MMWIRLQYNGKVIWESRDADIAQDIEIGRSSACAWRVPPEDEVISRQHAVLQRKGTEIWLHDKGSKSGTWLQGKRIEQRELKVGDQITMGHCILVVEEAPEIADEKNAPEIVVLTGKQRNVRKAIQGSKFTIGSDPQSSLLFLDDMVSRNHATILHKDDGSCWLKDLGSTNGTKVNDVPLRAQQERLLKDGDRIAVAHVEFVFHDGTAHEEQGQSLRRFGVMGALIVIAIGAYFAWQIVRPAADRYFQDAWKLAQETRFADARKKLDDAVDRRRYQPAEAEQLRAQINHWEVTFKSGQEVQDQLKGQHWSEAAAKLGGILALPSDYWGWNDGPASKKRAETIKQWLDVCLDVAHPEEMSMPILEAKGQALAGAIKSMETQKGMEALRKFATERQKVVADHLLCYHQLDDALKLLGVTETPPDLILTKLEGIVKNAEGRCRQRMEQVLQPLGRLAAGYRQLVDARQLACNLHFDEAAEAKVELPTPDECMINSNLTMMRGNLEIQSDKVKSQSRWAKSVVGELTNRLEAVDVVPPEMRSWDDLAGLEKVFACDSLSGPYLRRSRTEPQGEYDRAVCIENFYASLRWIADQRTQNNAKPPFASRLAATAQTVRAAQHAVDFFADPDHGWLLNGPVAQWQQAAKGILEKRDQIVEALLKAAQQASDRKAVITVGLAWPLLENPDKRKIGEQPLREWFVAKWTRLRHEVETLNQDREGVSSSERIRLRNKILEVGLPGEPVVNQMWLERAEAAAQ